MKLFSLPALGMTAALLVAGLLVASRSVAEGAPKSESATQADPMQIVRGAKAWSENCARCHNLRSPSELTDEEWDVSVTHMRIRANLPASDTDDIRAFLQASNN